MSPKLKALVSIIETAMAKTIVPQIVPMAHRQGVGGSELMLAMSVALTNNAVSLAAASIGATDEAANQLRTDLRDVVVSWIEKHGLDADDQPDDLTAE
jgi:hypothetical protein